MVYGVLEKFTQVTHCDSKRGVSSWKSHVELLPVNLKAPALANTSLNRLITPKLVRKLAFETWSDNYSVCFKG